MFSMKGITFALVLVLCSIQCALAVPTWEGMNGRSSIGSLIPGASQIEAKGPASSGKMAKHLSVQLPGQQNNITVTSGSQRTPPLFYINQDQLWLLVNETAVYPVNVYNSTGDHELPMQLILGNKREGITNGKWFWKTTQLYYDLPGGRTNEGLYFLCLTDSGWFNVFMTHIATRPPNGCSYMTLHSFIRGSISK